MLQHRTAAMYVSGCLILFLAGLPAQGQDRRHDGGQGTVEERVEDDFDPIGGGRALLGEVLVVSSQDGIVTLALDSVDEDRPLDGLVDYVATFRSRTPLQEPIYYRGAARVELRRSRVGLVAQDGSTAMVLSLGSAKQRVQGVLPSATVYRLGSGESLVYQSNQFDRSLEVMTSQVLETPFFDDDKGGGGGGCAASCSITCAGGGGSCSANCPAVSCASCSCVGEQNLASCSCSQ